MERRKVREHIIIIFVCIFCDSLQFVNHYQLYQTITLRWFTMETSTEPFISVSYVSCGCHVTVT